MQVVEQVVEVEVSLIDPGENDRTVFTEEDIGDLALDIKQHGQDDPIEIRPKANGRYDLIAGERRWRAHQHPNLAKPTIFAFIKDVDDREADRRMFTENHKRRNLDPIDEARGYHKPIHKYNLSIEDVARDYGVSVNRVKDRLALLELLPEIQVLVRSGQIGLTYAAEMKGLGPNSQMKAFEYFTDPKIREHTIEGFKAICNRIRTDQDQPGFDIFLNMPMETIVEELGAEIDALQTKDQLRSQLRDAESEVKRLDGMLIDYQAALDERDRTIREQAIALATLRLQLNQRR